MPTSTKAASYVSKLPVRLLQFGGHRLWTLLTALSHSVLSFRVRFLKGYCLTPRQSLPNQAQMAPSPQTTFGIKSLAFDRSNVTIQVDGAEFRKNPSRGAQKVPKTLVPGQAGP
jgi:hypothetical protein